MVRTRANDEDEQRLLDDVRDHGWHIVAIQDDPRGPAIAYSVGFCHTLGHPEVIMIGLNSIQTMGQIINGMGDLIRQGHRFEDGAETDLLLDGYSCVFRSVPKEVYPDYLGYAMWYYRPDEFSTVQCFWPDRSGRFPWDAKCDSSVRVRQPILYHLRGWRFFEPKNQAVFTTKFVVEKSLPILRVTHDTEGDWLFLCGTTDDVKDGLLVTLESIVEMSPGIDELADLPAGWRAERDSAGSPWIRSQSN